MKTKSIIILLMLSSISFSQNELALSNSSAVFDTIISFPLNGTLNNYKVHFMIIDTTYNDLPVTIYRSFIYNSSSEFIQSIIDTVRNMGHNKRMRVDRYSEESKIPNYNNDIAFIDINFDRNTDIRIRRHIDLQGQTSFRYFLYDQKTRQFIYNNSFSKLCCNLSINSEQKEIHLSNYNWLEEKETIRIYKVIDNNPVLSGIKTEYVFTDDNKQKYRTVLEKLIDGKMKVILDTVVWKGM